MFSGRFSGAFAHDAYICPVMAQAAIYGGAVVAVVGSALVIGGKKLIGPAGKMYAFESEATAEKWAANAALVVARERDILSSVPVAVAEGWKQKKREKLALIAWRLVGAAVKQSSAAKRAALIAEADYCLSKWQ